MVIIQSIPLDRFYAGCTPSDVTNLYSSLSLSLPSTNESGVAFKSANRFYVDNSVRDWFIFQFISLYLDFIEEWISEARRRQVQSQGKSDLLCPYQMYI